MITILCLKNCSPRDNNNTSSSNSSSEPTWTERDKSLDDVFKTIIEKQLEADGFAQDEVTLIVAVSYTDTAGSKFSLKIDAYSNSKVYYYRLDNCAYTGFDNFTSYILDYDFETYPCLDGNITISSLDISTETVVNISQSKERHIISKSPTNIKYFSGYYYDVDDQAYYIYHQKEYQDGANPFNNKTNKDAEVNKDSLLYNYYNYLSAQ